MVTLVEPVPVQPLLSVTVTLYVPELAGCAFVTDGFCELLVKEGPLQLYVEKVPEPPDGLVNKLS